jgi:hypothetical protein
MAVARQRELLRHEVDAVFDLAEVGGCRHGFGTFTYSRFETTSSGYKTRDHKMFDSLKRRKIAGVRF